MFFTMYSTCVYFVKTTHDVLCISLHGIFADISNVLFLIYALVATWVHCVPCGCAGDCHCHCYHPAHYHVQEPLQQTLLF